MGCRGPFLEMCDSGLESCAAGPYIMPLRERETPRYHLIAMSEHDKKDLNPNGHDLAVEEARPKLKRPPLYRVILINDDYTPMEFVVEVLQSIFGMERPNATRVMLEVHTKGKGICGVYDYEIAETKVAQVISIAQQQQHPLLCTMEES